MLIEFDRIAVTYIRNQASRPIHAIREGLKRLQHGRWHQVGLFVCYSMDKNYANHYQNILKMGVIQSYKRSLDSVLTTLYSRCGTSSRRATLVDVKSCTRGLGIFWVVVPSIGSVVEE